MARSSSYRRGRTCTDPGGVVYVPPPPPRSKVGESRRGSSERARLGRRGTGRGIPRKSGGMYAVITDFSLQLQRSEKTGTELGTACRRRCRTPMPLDRCGEGHTNWRDRRGVRIRSDGACPRPGKPGRGCARASSLTMHATVPPDRYGAWRVAALRDAGSWAIRTQRWHTSALGALASSTCRPCQGKRMPPYSYRPALGGRREHGGHTPSWQGRAVRGGSPRGGVSIGLTASRTASGSGCPLRPRGEVVGRVAGWAGSGG